MNRLKHAEKIAFDYEGGEVLGRFAQQEWTQTLTSCHLCYDLDQALNSAWRWVASLLFHSLLSFPRSWCVPNSNLGVVKIYKYMESAIKFKAKIQWKRMNLCNYEWSNKNLPSGTNGFSGVKQTLDIAATTELHSILCNLLLNL